jgi:hypothetical protein
LLELNYTTCSKKDSILTQRIRLFLSSFTHYQDSCIQGKSAHTLLRPLKIIATEPKEARQKAAILVEKIDHLKNRDGQSTIPKFLTYIASVKEKKPRGRLSFKFACVSVATGRVNGCAIKRSPLRFFRNWNRTPAPVEERLALST